MYDNKLFIDIETLPPQGGDHLARIKATIRPPAQYKKPESIAEWLAANAEAAAQEEFARLGLNGLYGQICCVGFAVNDDAVEVIDIRDYHEEGAFLSAVFARIEECSTDLGGPRFLSPVGHNVEFDVRFIMQRAVRHCLMVPKCLRTAFDPEKGRYQLFDTMRVWAGFKDYVKLKDLARELLNDDTTDIDGADVARVWATEPAKVVEHCRRDVERVRSLYRMFMLTLQGAA